MVEPGPHRAAGVPQPHRGEVLRGVVVAGEDADPVRRPAPRRSAPGAARRPGTTRSGTAAPARRQDTHRRHARPARRAAGRTAPSRTRGPRPSTGQQPRPGGRRSASGVQRRRGGRPPPVTPASSSKLGVPYSNRSGTASEDGTSFAGRSALPARRVGDARRQVRPGPLVGAGHVEVGAERGHVGRPVRRWRARRRRRPARRPRARSRRSPATSGRGADGVAGRGHRDQPGPLGRPGRAYCSRRQLTGARGRTSAQRTVAPARSATCTHGRTLASWSSRDTTISSPGPPAFAPASGPPVGQRGRTRPEHHPGRVGADAGRPRPTRACCDDLAAPAGPARTRCSGCRRPRAGPSVIGVGHRLGDQGAAGTVEVHEALGQGGIAARARATSNGIPRR